MWLLEKKILAVKNAAFLLFGQNLRKRVYNFLFFFLTSGRKDALIEQRIKCLVLDVGIDVILLYM